MIVLMLLGLAVVATGQAAAAETCLPGDALCASFYNVGKEANCANVRSEVGGWGSSTTCIPILHFDRPSEGPL